MWPDSAATSSVMDPTGRQHQGPASLTPPPGFPPGHQSPNGHQAIIQDPTGGPPVTVMVDASGIKAAAKKRNCVVYDIDPHMYIDNVKNATIDDVISASMSLLESMILLGLPVHNYAKHIRFLSDKAKVYHSTALVKYDAAMRLNAEMYGHHVFVYGDHELYHSLLGVENLRPKTKQPSVIKSKTVRTRGMCWDYNKSKGCKRESCPYKHECKECGGSHGFMDCKQQLKK